MFGPDLCTEIEPDSDDSVVEMRNERIAIGHKLPPYGS